MQFSLTKNWNLSWHFIYTMFFWGKYASIHKIYEEQVIIFIKCLPKRDHFEQQNEEGSLQIHFLGSCVYNFQETIGTLSVDHFSQQSEVVFLHIKFWDYCRIPCNLLQDCSWSTHKWPNGHSLQLHEGDLFHPNIWDFSHQHFQVSIYTLTIFHVWQQSEAGYNLKLVA